MIAFDARGTETTLTLEKDWTVSKWAIVRGSIVGFFVGLLPGGGAVIASMYIGNVMLLILNLPLVGVWVQMLKAPYSILAPGIVLNCAIGVYSMKSSIGDVVMMVIFGVVGYVLRRLQFELGPILLAFVLGRILERSLRQALLISRGDISIFVTKPISAVLLGIAAVMILTTIVVSLCGTWKTRAQAVA